MWIVLVVDVDHRRSTATRMQGDSEDYELKQMRDMAAAKKRWEALVCQKNLFWVQGGVEAAEEEDLAREGPLPFKFAGIGGLLEFLGSAKGCSCQRKLELPISVLCPAGTGRSHSPCRCLISWCSAIRTLSSG